MKKTFLLLFGLIGALCANATNTITVYSWSSNGTVTENGGTVSYLNGPSNTERVNVEHTFNTYTSKTEYTENTYYTLEVDGAYASMTTETPSTSSGYLQFVLDDAFQKGDKITITGYRHKSSNSITSSYYASLYMLFGDDVSDKSVNITQTDGLAWPNLYSSSSRNDYCGDGNAQTTIDFTVPDGAAGMNVFNISRYYQKAPIYITSIKVTREVSPSATYSTTCAAGCINTFCYPYTVKTPSGATFYKFLGQKDDYVYGEEVTDDELEAGFPYLYVPESTSITCEVTGSDYTAAKSSNGLYGNLGVGKKISGHDYMLFTTTGLKYCTSVNYNYVKQYGCYVVAAKIADLGSSSSAKAVKLLTVEEDESETATGITSVQSASANAPMYSVSGQRISNVQKGQIYIVKGKKYIAK